MKKLLSCNFIPIYMALLGSAGWWVRSLLPPNEQGSALLLPFIFTFIFVGGGILGFKCNKKARDKIQEQIYPQDVRQLVGSIKNSGWSGKSESFNQSAKEILYGKGFSGLLDANFDYLSKLKVDELIEITSITDIGSNPDGTPNTTINISLTTKANDLLNEWGS